MKKINFDVLIKIIILLIFSGYYIFLVCSNKIITYIHPRIIPFTFFAAILMIVTSIFQIPLILSITKKKICLRNYVFFIIPIMLITLVQNPDNPSTTYKDSTEKSTNNTSSDNYEIYAGKTETYANNDTQVNNLDIKNNTISVTPKNYIFTLDTILNNPEKYYGYNIYITGFVYRDNTFKQTEFLIARYLMVCCAADMQIAGIKCINNNNSTFDSNTWIKVSGKIIKDPTTSTSDPIINIEHVEKDLNPDASYVYPY